MKTIRSLTRVPGFSLTVIVTFTIATTVLALTSALVWHILVRQMPFPDARRLVFVWNRYGADRVESSSLSAPDFNDRRQAHAFESAAVWKDLGVNLSDGAPLRLDASAVSDDFFRVLGVAPAIGRFPQGSEEAVVLSDHTWRSVFGARHDIENTIVHFDGKPLRVAAVMPRDFNFPSRQTDVWTPLRLTGSDFADDNRGNEYYSMIARLRSGTTLEQAQAEMSAITQAVFNRVPERTPFLQQVRWHVDVFPLRDDLVRRAKPALLVLLGAGVLVMMLAGTNVLGLFIARAASRERDVAVRRMLGATPMQLGIGLTSEVVVLAAIGAAIGVIAARGLLPAVAETGLPRVDEVAIGVDVIAFAAGVTIATALAIGAIVSVWLRPARIVTERGATGSAAMRRLRTLVVSVQIAIAMTLLASGGLLVESYRRLRGVEIGFDSHQLLTFRIELPPKKCREAEQRRAFFGELQERLARMPGVVSSSATTDLPYSPSDWTATFDIPGYDTTSGEPPSAHFRVIGLRYPETMRIPLLGGRSFTAADREGTPEVCLIDTEAARRYWPGANAVGKRIDFGDHRGITVIGVVGAVRENSRATAAEPHVYFPLLQRHEGELSGVVRTTADPLRLAGDVRAIVRALDGGQPVFAIRTMDDTLDEAIAEPRLRAAVVASSAGVAILLAVISLYSLISYVVTARTREVGVRMALGATSADIARTFVEWSASVAAAGVLAGSAVTLIVMRFIRAVLFDVDAIRYRTLTGLALAFLFVATAAALAPALRAARIDPAEALRHD